MNLRERGGAERVSWQGWRGKIAVGEFKKKEKNKKIKKEVG